MELTDCHAKYFAYELKRRCPTESVEKLTTALADAQVNLRLVKRYGKGLLPELFDHLNPTPYQSAIEMEQDLADELQEKGWGVWQA